VGARDETEDDFNGLVVACSRNNVIKHFSS
jgi:hypothetical protein